jgi:hypothetical protein
MTRPSRPRRPATAAPPSKQPLDPAGRAGWGWPALLIAISMIGSLLLACATPFAALAVIAATTLARRGALLVVAAIWLTNQAVGYGVLFYPLNIDSLAWGVAIGLAALAATATASLVAGRSHRSPVVTLAAALALAFATYEGGLMLAALLLGSEEAFAAPIVGQLALLNAAWMIGLAAVNGAWRRARHLQIGVAGAIGPSRLAT